MDDLRQWTASNLGALLGLGLEDATPLVDHILSFTEKPPAEVYLRDFLGGSAASAPFITTFLCKRFPSTTQDRVPKEKDEASTGVSTKQRKRLAKLAGVSLAEYERLVSNESPSHSLTSLQHRPLCPCNATLHSLLTNCLRCGHIVCSQEGSGPCAFCGSFVESKEQQTRLMQEGKLGRVDVEVLEKAMEAARIQRDKLLDFDRNSTARTKVHDQSSDYNYTTVFSNQWLTAEERALLLKKVREKEDKASQRRTKVTLDLATKTVVEEAEEENGETVDDVLREFQLQISIREEAARRKEGASSSSLGLAEKENMLATEDQESSSHLVGGTGMFQNPTLEVKPRFVDPSKQPKAKQNKTTGIKGHKGTAGQKESILEKPQEAFTFRKTMKRLQHDMGKLGGEVEFDEYAAEGGSQRSWDKVNVGGNYSGVNDDYWGQNEGWS